MNGEIARAIVASFCPEAIIITGNQEATIDPDIVLADMALRITHIEERLAVTE